MVQQFCPLFVEMAEVDGQLAIQICVIYASYAMDVILGGIEVISRRWRTQLVLRTSWVLSYVGYGLISDASYITDVIGGGYKSISRRRRTLLVLPINTSLAGFSYIGLYVVVS